MKQGFIKGYVESIIKEKPPSLIVFDLLDHVEGYNQFLGKEGNTTERYSALYQWARTIAAEHCPVIAVSQLSGEGNNEPFPSMAWLAGSRVAKQSAATVMLMLGSREGNSTDRFLSAPKNKISSNKGWRASIKFDPQRSRFSD